MSPLAFVASRLLRCIKFVTKFIYTFGKFETLPEVSDAKRVEFPVVLDAIECVDLTCPIPATLARDPDCMGPPAKVKCRYCFGENSPLYVAPHDTLQCLVGKISFLSDKFLGNRMRNSVIVSLSCPVAVNVDQESFAVTTDSTYHHNVTTAGPEHIPPCSVGTTYGGRPTPISAVKHISCIAYETPLDGVVNTTKVSRLRGIPIAT